jgi:hypothetical protein
MGATPTIYARSRDRWRAYTSNIYTLKYYTLSSQKENPLELLNTMSSLLTLTIEKSPPLGQVPS